jgi:2-polyprenyl-6-methoxyphenol hydroxylase-like FAD-dependent oxidoreductase
VPQDCQVHALLAIGVRAMETLVPGLTEQLRAEGGVLLDAGCEVAIYEAEGWAGRVRSDAYVISMRRTHLEHLVRRRVLELPGVRLLAGQVTGLVVAPGSRRVSGVRLADSAHLDAELVVDAGGRGSRSPAWLVTEGFGRPAEQELRSYVGYATVPVRLPDGVFPDGVPAILSHPHPGNHYGSSVIPVGDGLHLFGALGMMKCYPPTGRDDFLTHLEKASSPLVADLAHQAQFQGEIVGYRMPGTRRRLWERLEDRPDGFAVVGDAVLSINPLYGQGMSVAAVEAAVLRTLLREMGLDRPDLGRRIQDAIVPVVEQVFQLVIGIDSRYPEAKPIGLDRLPEEMLAMGRALGELATVDAEVSRAFRYAVHFFAGEELATPSVLGKLTDWMRSDRVLTHNDPRTVLGILGVAAPITTPLLGVG